MQQSMVSLKTRLGKQAAIRYIVDQVDAIVSTIAQLSEQSAEIGFTVWL